MSEYKEAFVLRTEQDWTKLAPLASVAANLGHEAWQLSGDWRLITVKHVQPAEEWPASIAEATGAPALWCSITVFDSTILRGHSASGTWEGWARTGGFDEEIAGMQFAQYDFDELLDPDNPIDGEQEQRRLAEQAFRDVTAAIPALATAAAQWARDAGHEVPVASVQALLESDEPFGSRLLNNLLQVLGITDQQVL